jgi:hypothetical protein
MKKETEYKRIKKLISGGVSLEILEEAQHACDIELANFRMRKKDAERLYAKIGCRRAWLYRVLGFLESKGIM